MLTLPPGDDAFILSLAAWPEKLGLTCKAHARRSLSLALQLIPRLLIAKQSFASSLGKSLHPKENF